jgi:prepilin-type N-terminal cleavage/methylation domain-containing protein
MKINYLKYRSRAAFTLMETMVVIIIMGIFVTFSYPAYNKYLERQKDRDALMVLNLMIGADKIYDIKNGEYLPDTDVLDDINAGLNLKIQNETDWDYATFQDQIASGQKASATRQSGPRIRTWQIWLDGTTDCTPDDKCYD